MKDIAFHITDIAENGIRAGAGEIRIGVTLDGERLELSVADDGCGMAPETLARAVNPFYTTRTTRKVGLGLPFLIQNAEQSGGTVEIESELGVGTLVKAVFMLDNIDCPPVGDLATAAMLIMTGNPGLNTIFSVLSGVKNFEISTKAIREAVGGIPIGLPEVSLMVREIIAGNIGEVTEGRL